MFIVCKRFEFEAAHRLDAAFSKECVSEIHGHSYVVEVELAATQLDANGMVIDFGLVKERLGPHIDRFDHALILSDSVGNKETYSSTEGKRVFFPGNPTAEVMALAFYNGFTRALRDLYPRVVVRKVRVHETRTGWAEYFPLEGARL